MPVFEVGYRVVIICRLTFSELRSDGTKNYETQAVDTYITERMFVHRKYEKHFDYEFIRAQIVIDMSFCVYN